MAEAQFRYKSPLRYPGGKQKALKQIVPLLPQSVREYREPMVGGGSVFFAARGLGVAERYWINDLFPDLFHFWQGVQDPATCARLRAELAELRASFGSPEETKEYFLRVRDEATEDPYRQALLFFFFNRVTFSGTTRAGGFSKQAAVRRFTASSIERLAPMPQALAGVAVTSLDFAEVIQAPGEDVFVFLDPPYYTAQRLYGRAGGLHEFDHERLAAVLKETQHRFLMTYDDCPEVRALYNWANVQAWQLQYGMNNCSRDNLSKIGSELFVSNYETRLQGGAHEHKQHSTTDQLRLSFDPP